MTFTTHNFEQGSPTWLQHRMKHRNSSDTSALLGISSYRTRTDLIRLTATGMEQDIDAATRRRFNDGHEYEAIARPWAEDIVGEELFPATVSRTVDGVPLSASLDGMTMSGSVLWEHKTLNQELADAMDRGEIPEEYLPQMDQALGITGAEKYLFMASAGSRETMRYCWYTPEPGRFRALVKAWRQFDEDVKAYKPDPQAEVIVGRAPSALPALLIQVTGAVTQSNLPEFKARAIEVFRSIKTDLQTDSDFADAEQTVKFCKDIEERLDAAKQHALSQTATIDELFKALDAISAEARAKRLELDKSVKSRKETIRLEIIRGGEQAFREHVATINQRLGKVSLPLIQANFAGVIKGLKTVASIKDAVATELARVKIEANAVGEKIDANLRTLRELAAEHAFLFADAQQLVVKENGDLVNLIKTRIADHKAEQQRREEATRPPSPVPPAAPAATAAPAPAAKPRMRADGPTGWQVIALVADTYGVTQDTAHTWLMRMDFHKYSTAVAE